MMSDSLNCERICFLNINNHIKFHRLKYTLKEELGNTLKTHTHKPTLTNLTCISFGKCETFKKCKFMYQCRDTSRFYYPVLLLKLEWQSYLGVDTMETNDISPLFIMV